MLSRNVHAGVTARDSSVVRYFSQTGYWAESGVDRCARGGSMECVGDAKGFGLAV